MIKCKNDIISDGLSKQGIVTPKKDIVRLSFPTLHKLIPNGNSNFTYHSKVIIPDDMVGDDGIGSLLYRVGVVVYRDRNIQLTSLLFTRISVYYFPLEGLDLTDAYTAYISTFPANPTILADAVGIDIPIEDGNSLNYLEMRRDKHASYFTKNKARPMGIVYCLFNFEIQEAHAQTLLVTPFTDFTCLKD